MGMVTMGMGMGQSHTMGMGMGVGGYGNDDNYQLHQELFTLPFATAHTQPECSKGTKDDINLNFSRKTNYLKRGLRNQKLLYEKYCSQFVDKYNWFEDYSTVSIHDGKTR